MGYTNYWNQTTDFTDKEWDMVRKEFKYIREIAGDKIKVEDDSSNVIAFNGGVEGNCETFILFKHAKKKADYEGQDIGFRFCKTRAMTYDIYVWHLLTVCTVIKKGFTINRD